MNQGSPRSLTPCDSSAEVPTHPCRRSSGGAPDLETIDPVLPPGQVAVSNTVNCALGSDGESNSDSHHGEKAAEDISRTSSENKMEESHETPSSFKPVTPERRRRKLGVAGIPMYERSVEHLVQYRPPIDPSPTNLGGERHSESSENPPSPIPSAPANRKRKLGVAGLNEFDSSGKPPSPTFTRDVRFDSSGGPPSPILCPPENQKRKKIE